MFKRSFSSKHRTRKPVKTTKKKYDKEVKEKMERNVEYDLARTSESPLNSLIVVVTVGKEKRIFHAHEDVLTVSPQFYDELRDQNPDENGNKKLSLPDEEPEIFSCIMQFVYQGDYYPRLFRSKRTTHWYLENATETDDLSSSEPTLFHRGFGNFLMRDTVVYCAAVKYGLGRLKSLALQKHALQLGLEPEVILRSALYAQNNLPTTDEGLPAWHLSYIVRHRHDFKECAMLSREMEKGGGMFFGLFVAMCERMDELESTRYV
ncbi:hypothetical protein N7539_001666 [Penicillium diatomitis]|uniref:BTB domain-containing protein n=1 Tax=Penicillium diatomitis TaxID=2819901 RepID=A0A9W9XI22_9EURO|nr:uncharacterized protein N7539_001666 [Penicillium diatomitis]KAJ5492920.1 hypothetical protein N7539_001666 [Penicillium diatomitis]